MRLCPACKTHRLGEENAQPLQRIRYELPTKGALLAGYDVMECATCGMLYADNLPSEEAYIEYYGAQSKKASHFSNAEPEWYQRIHRSSAKWLNKNVNLHDALLLEPGCFTGDFLSKLMKYGPGGVYGYDPSESGVAIAQKNGFGFSVQRAASYAETGWDIIFDGILLSHVLEHIRNIDTFMDDIKLAMDGKSWLFIEVPDAEAFTLMDSDEFMVDQRQPLLQFSPEHINYFTRYTLQRMMSRLGFECIKIKQCRSGVMVLRGLFKMRRSTRKSVGAYILDSMDRLKASMAKIPKGEPVYIWGAGGYTQTLLGMVEHEGLQVHAFIDNEPAYRGAELLGRPVIMPHEVNLPYQIVLATYMYQDEILRQIDEQHIYNRVIRL